MSKFYFASDGNWGSADDLLVADFEPTGDNHFWDSLEYTTDSNRMWFVQWFIANDHPYTQGEWAKNEFACTVCLEWDSNE